MWATEESSHNPSVRLPQWEEQPAASIEVHLSMATCRIKTTAEQPLWLVHLLSLPLEGTLLDIQKGHGRGYYFVREYFQLTKDEKYASSPRNSR